MLKSRLIDRPIRPLFPEGFRNEVQVVATVLSHDLENDPDIVAMIGCSAALTLSGIPFFGPVAAARVGYEDGQYILNPTADQMKTQPARPGGRRHGRRRADGRVRGAGAVRGRHARRRHLRPRELPAGDPGDHRAGRARRQGPVAAARAVGRGAGAEGPRRCAGPRRPGRGLSRAGQAGARTTRSMRSKQRRWPRRWPPRAWTPRRRRALFHDLEADIVRNAILDTGMRIDGRDTTHRAADHRRGRHPAARARLRAVHPRRDPGVLRRHARHRPGRADHRRARGRVPRALHAALQLPALFGGRGRPHGLARAGARSGTASWPGGRSIRCCRRRTSSPTRCASSPRSPRATARRRWRRCAAARWR